MFDYFNSACVKNYKMKIPQRLKHIDAMITRDYDHIWDCCCDHGLLGLMILERETSKMVHFVDVVESILIDLREKLEKYFPLQSSRSKWLIHHQDLNFLRLLNQDDCQLSNRTEETHLVIIAGVGGEQLIEFLDSIIHSHRDLYLEFILCPVHHNFKVRSRLIDLGLYCINECLIEENNRYYEILHVCTKNKKSSVDSVFSGEKKTVGFSPVSPAGDAMWDLNNVHHKYYLLRTIQHYQRVSNQTCSNASAFAKKALWEYEKILLR